jgi:hypothetical protein
MTGQANPAACSASRAAAAFSQAWDDGLAAGLWRALVLGRALIGLQSAQRHHRRMRLDGARQFDHLGGRHDAASGAAHIDLDQHFDAAALLAQGLGERLDLGGVVDTHAHRGPLGQAGQARQLGRADHLVADQHVADATVDKDLGLAHLLAAHADRTGGHLAARDLDALVRLAVGAQREARAGHRAVNGLQVGFEGIEVEQQGRRIDLGDRVADAGGECHVIAPRCPRHAARRSGTGPPPVWDCARSR